MGPLGFASVPVTPNVKHPLSTSPTVRFGSGGFLREAEAGLPIAELCRKHAFSEASYYLWRSKFGGMSVSDAKRLKELELENSRLKRLLAESMLENEVTKEALRKKW